jgi:hypothetical protein
MDRIIPARVLERRTALDLTQKEVAERIYRLGFGPMNYQSIQQLEDGDVKKPSYARYLPDALETTWEYLTGKTDNPVGPLTENVNPIFMGSAPNNGVHTRKGIGSEGNPYMLTEISRMLGQMEGRMEARFDARFDAIDAKLSDHDKRLNALEDRPLSGPQKGRRR